MNLFENETVAIRRFTPEDWRDVLDMVQSNLTSEFASCDEQWPSDEDSIQSVTAYIATDPAMYAVVAKDIHRVVAFVNFNGIRAEKYLDIGHIMNLNYIGHNYEFEGLRLLYNHAFATMDIDGICAYWAYDDKIKLEPLFKLGMTVTATGQNKYFDGREGTFTGCELKVSREEYFRKFT